MESFATIAPRVVLAFAAVVLPVLFFVPAPYGRHYREGFGPSMNARLAWLVMEAPALFLFAWAWRENPHGEHPLVAALGVAWCLHYAQRTFVFSLLMRDAHRRKPLLTVALALVFNGLNAVGNGLGLRPREPDAAFLAGLGLFVVGMGLNLHSDHLLRGLRRLGETGYRVPTGGAFRFVSAPNYLGELLEWVGFAVAAQTWAAWAFAAFTFANLAPRARSNHRWYLAHFPDYPRARRALVPFLW